MRRTYKYDYEEYHKVIDNVLYKRCMYHEEFFNEEGWFPCTKEYFYTNKTNKTDGYHPECKKCSIKKATKWQKDNPELYNENAIKFNSQPKSEKIKLYWREKGKRQRDSGYMTEWRRNHPESCHEYTKAHRNHDITTSEYQSLLKVFDNSCAYCGMSEFEHREKFNQKLHNDHVDENGYNDLRNDVPACKSCNCGKHQSNVEEWFRKQEFFNQERLDKINWWITEGYKSYIEEKPSYIIKRKRHEFDNNYDFNLWSFDEKRNMKDIIFTSSNKKEVLNYINEYNI